MSNENNDLFPLRPSDGPNWNKKVVRPSIPRKPHWIQKIVSVILVLGIGYGLYVWEVCRVVVDPNHVLVLIRKNGSKSLPGDNVIIPAAARCE